MENAHDLWAVVDKASADVQLLGDASGLPYIAVQSDLGNPEPMLDASGQPFVETRFQWPAQYRGYWKNRRIALDHPLLNAARLIAEPFMFDNGGLSSWRPVPELTSVDCSEVTSLYGIVGAIVSPVHLPGGRVGVVVWACADKVYISTLFDEYASAMHLASIRLIGAHAEASVETKIQVNAAHLTRREVQIARWASRGKTDAEIGLILGISTSTVRFHLRNAAAKFGVCGRTQLIRRATGLGFIGDRP